MSEQLVARAIEAIQSEDFATARAYMALAKRIQPFEAKHYLIGGLSEIALKDWTAAAATFGEAVAAYPSEPQLWFNLGIAQDNLGDYDKATGSYERCLIIDPLMAEACGNLSNVYCRIGKFGEAEDMARKALDLGAPRAQALNSLALAFNRQHKFVEAQAVYEEALQLEPHNLFVWINLANMFVDQLEFDRAWQCFGKARAAAGDQPRLQYQEAMARLLSGDFTRGWPLYEARLELPAALRIQPACPLYDGGLLAGKKVLMVAEQGLGDAIQFARYGGFAAQAGAELIWVVPKALQCLLKANLRGTVLSEEEELPAADYYLPLLSLPVKLHKLTPQQSPRSVYIRMPKEPALPAPQKAGRKIGLVWAGSKTHERDFERSIPLAKFAPLFEKNGAQFYAPFVGAGLEQIGSEPVMRLDTLIRDFADTAGLLQQLDCLVTVDTAVAHLAGAMGVKTYLLLPYCPDWRWGTQGETTGWYPSFALLRQKQPGDWDEVIGRLTESLSS